MRRRMSAAVAAPSFTMKLPCVGDTRAADRHPLEPCAIHQGASRPGDALRHNIRGRALDSETRSRRSAYRAAGSASGTPATPAPWHEGRKRHLKRFGTSPTAAPRRSSCSRLRSYPNAIADRGTAVVAPSRRLRGGPRDQFANQPAAEMRVAEDRAADRAGRAGPCFQAGAAVRDRPPHQAVDRHGRVRANALLVQPRNGTASRANHESANARVGDQHVGAAAEQRHRQPRDERSSTQQRSLRRCGYRPANRPGHPPETW